jgi:hypothetical protein
VRVKRKQTPSEAEVPEAPESLAEADERHSRDEAPK